MEIGYDLEPVTAIFHITHLNNLAKIVASGELCSDRRLAETADARTVIGYDHIKQRRMYEIDVPCHAGTKVGDFVPFYFCPRSPMLHVIHKQNDSLSFKGGQEKILHLVSSVEAATTLNGYYWAFSDGNAGSYHTQFYSDVSLLASKVNWPAVNATWWSGPRIDPSVKYHKQAEFLVYYSFPWTAFHEIAVYDMATAKEVAAALRGAGHCPPIYVRREWYY